MNQNWTASDMPSLTGKSALVTGANSGLGFETSKMLAANGARVVLACRNKAKAQKATESIKNAYPSANVKFHIVDLADLKQVLKLSDWMKQEFDQLDILVNNAGIMMTPEGTTEQGFESQLGVNYLSHFYLTGKLLPLLEKTDSRVVNVSSLAAKQVNINWEDLQFRKKYNAWEAYAQSKLLMLMFSLELHQRLRARAKKVKCLAAHPGFSSTQLFKPLEHKLPNVLSWLGKSLLMPLFSQSAGMGALPQLYAATAPEAVGGGYYGPGGWRERKGFPSQAEIPTQAIRPEQQQKVWEITEQLLDFEFKINATPTQ